MNDGEMLLRAILNDPGDNGARLAYADWSEEHGQSARAEFIRVQCALANLVDQPLNPATLGSGPALRRRVRELLTLTVALGHGWTLARAGLGTYLRPPVALSPSLSFPCEARRGFVESLTCSAADFLAHESAIRAAQPVTRVRLTTLPVGDGKPRHTPAGMPEGYAAEAALNQLRHLHHWTRAERLLDVLRRVWPRMDFEVPQTGYLDDGLHFIAGEPMRAGQVTVAGVTGLAVLYRPEAGLFQVALGVVPRDVAEGERFRPLMNTFPTPGPGA